MVRYVSSRSPNDWATSDLGKSQFADEFVRVQNGVLGHFKWSEPNSSAPSDTSTVLSNMDGSGTSSDPYIIRNDHELQAMEADLGAHYKLGSFIDATETGQWNSGNGYNPIGTSSNTFIGSFDGNGYVIDGLTIDRPSTDGCGLIGYIDGATVSDVSMKNVDILGNGDMGGVVGDGYSGTVTRCFSSGTISTGATDTGSFVGGIIGQSSGASFSECYTTCDVTAATSIGGAVGSMNSSGSASNVFAAGTVNGGSGYVGGFAGSNDGNLTDTYWDTEATGESSGVGNGSGSPTGLTTSKMQGSSASTNMSGLNFSNTWTTVSSDYPDLQALN